jgi:hypothetical protein
MVFRGPCFNSPKGLKRIAQSRGAAVINSQGRKPLVIVTSFLL